MNRIKCESCGFINFSTETICKRCNQILNRVTGKSERKVLGELKIKSRISGYAIALLLISGILILITAFLVVFYRDGFRQDVNELSLVFFLFGIIPLLCSLYALKFFLGVKNVSVYEKGLIYSEKSKETVLFWDDIVSISETVEWLIVQGMPIGRGTVMMLKTNEDEEIILMQDIGGLREIRKFILMKCKTASHTKYRKFDIDVSI